MRDAVRAEFGEPGVNGRYELPLERLLQILESSDDQALRAKAGIYDDGLSRRPQDRNNSLLAHVVKPVIKAGFEPLWEAALAASAVAEADIFPAVRICS